MFKISVALLALIAGATATESCGGNRDFVTFREICHTENPPRDYPGTAEEVEPFCTFATGYYGCGVKFAKSCDNSDLLEETSNYLSVFQEICNQDSLLYAAIVDNVQCFSELMEVAPQQCRRQHMSTSNETLQKYTEALIEDGLLDLSNDNDKLATEKCIHRLQEFACYATKIEDKCGTVAVDTYLEVTQKFSTVATCGETYHYLPTIIRVYKLQKEEAN